MARSKFKGDGVNLLPAQQREPYRLWFEFVKLAHKDTSVKINKRIYRPWGDIENTDFNDWWENNWKQLFSIDVGVCIFDTETDKPSINTRELIVRIPLSQSPKKTLSQVSELLKTNGASDKLKDMDDGQFRLQVISSTGNTTHPSTRFLRNLPKVRLLLNIYKYWISHEKLDDKRRLEQTAISYFEWANGWNAKVKDKNWKRLIIEIPYALKVYVEYLKSRGDARRIKLYTSKFGDVSDHRRQVARYIRKARLIGQNVSEGIFPGYYE